jgi:acyl-CoA synthetase (AMP-forming)/AMP-acid ligase II
MPLGEFVLANTERLGAKLAVIDAITGQSYTYRELHQRAHNVASNLSRRGLKKHDVCAIFSPNSIEYPVAFLGIALAGGTTTTIHSQYTAQEAAQQLRDSRARFLFTAPAFMERALAAGRTAYIEEIFTFGEAPGATSFAALSETSGRAPAIAFDPATDVVALPYSSGTTGLSKGVMLTHRNLVANILQIESRGHLSPSDTLVGVLPMFHIYGLSVILCQGLHAGTTIVTLPRYDLDLLLHALAQHRVTFAHLVPPILLALSKDPSVERHDLSALRTLFSGAAPLSAALIRACSRRLGCGVEQGYGLTETSPGTHFTVRDAAEDQIGSVGTCLPETECKLIDPVNGGDLDASRASEPGEICIRGPQVMKGYSNQPEATRATLDAHGWLHTGDIGRIDARGHLFVVDRVKELIKYKGCQVAPAELEAILLEHTCVTDAAVIPVADEEAGEVPKAFVVLARGASPEEILAFVAARVAPFKRVRQIEVVGEIPKSASGKILRRVLVERERARRREG